LHLISHSIQRRKLSVGEDIALARRKMGVRCEPYGWLGVVFERNFYGNKKLRLEMSRSFLF
jgi:hypothetical protein